ncbi:YbaB/EbfC family nucleoid-associated protein [Saccharopolyspora indica]|uniref:YbaB/EbfC family nucleoid-associated protein n=1 Tax=Saccharopolyspora indica TaxID=1229659 RepID=UPI0022EA8380|nr:YbaB/EbfC family nucleoid-associated protein [Saccharopolyspora indica]MDA3647202.1 YbaB/EbfC family nucleoid-associated protein [Saccharopolyspora indica]
MPVIGAGLDVRAWRRRLLSLRDQVRTAAATADSEAGLITATVGGRGQLLDLRLDPRIYRVSDSTRLATEITATVREAIDQVRAQIAADLQHALPEGRPRS